MKIPSGFQFPGGIFLFCAAFFTALILNSTAAPNPLSLPGRFRAEISVPNSLGAPITIIMHVDGNDYRQENIIPGPNREAPAMFHKIWIARPDSTWLLNPKTHKYVVMPNEDAPPNPVSQLNRAIWQKMDTAEINGQSVIRYRVIASNTTPRDLSQARLPWEKILFSSGDDTDLCWVNPYTHLPVKTQNERLSQLSNTTYYMWHIEEMTKSDPKLFLPPEDFTKVDSMEQLESDAPGK